MPYTDTVTNPDNPTVTLYKHEQNELPLLKEACLGVVDMQALGLSDEPANLIGPQYRDSDLRAHTYRMMQLMMISYDKPKHTIKLEDIPEETKAKLKPFAHFLAIIDGNAFGGLIDQYIPDVYAFMTFDNQKPIDDTLKIVNDLSV